MKIKSFIPFVLLLTIGMVSITGCQKGDLIDNPNVASNNSLVPVSLLLNTLTSNLIRTSELPWGTSSVGSQFDIANYSYYRGTNNYNYGSTTDSYDIFKYAIKLQQQSTLQLSNQTNKYYALSLFFKAYSGIWLAQRVGDIPFSQAGNATNLTPKYDTQHDVYASALSMLDNANTLLGNLITKTPTLANTVLDSSGDIFGLTYLQWQKIINTYRLRVLISLSKRAVDNADLQIPQQFVTIMGNPTQYPIMTSNSDNLVYKFNATNRYPTFSLGYNPYNNFSNIGSTYLNITTATQDPRTFVVATPAPASVAGGKAVSDFTAYVGSDINQTQPTLLNNSNNGLYSFANYNRYYVSSTGASAEPFVFIGYSEMCFNIAEAINRGWITGNSATWYTNGINASLANYGLTNGEVLTISFPVTSTNTALNPSLIVQGGTWGTATVNITQFLANVAYAGDNATGLTQILTQKYVSMFNNSGWEAFYNFRRTGVPTFGQGGAGIGTPNNLIPRRWEYPSSESASNTANYQAALQSQFGSTTDDPTKDTWLTK
ncbi:SusD-like starch-binding protein associating with outer membrane [Mucilaginibacter frigoritolerans]|uniref:SusD-like starch-binding protein associating with outer membrane n=1 Tax=Mucilaginibacter frigoritolerans TaxID=652788 RepID=A0A562UFW3_9SPHI|nr:SusD/RagB family nutrient-binding outer membrane lipoprotein [Mucilaginibacter frigoritolerans]TWJ04694.1 SusD-like starch-binding protein associating with outer membrane [Mucilaginibacter frigoritolerans]